MRKKLFLPILFLVLIGTNSCAELQQVIDEYPISNTMDNATIASGLREALDKGIEKQVSKLTKKDGFNKNDLVRIMLPSELQKVDKTLRDLGLDNLADEGLKIMNRAAEEDRKSTRLNSSHVAIS